MNDVDCICIDFQVGEAAGGKEPAMRIAAPKLNRSEFRVGFLRDVQAQTPATRD